MHKTVARILEDDTYLGHTVNLKTTTVSYKNKKTIYRPESEQLRFENTHEPLVDQQTWEIAQSIRQHKRRPAKFAEQNMFSGLVYCKDCGGTMVLHRAHTMDTTIQQNDTDGGSPPCSVAACPKYLST